MLLRDLLRNTAASQTIILVWNEEEIPFFEGSVIGLGNHYLNCYVEQFYIRPEKENAIVIILRP